MELPFSREQFFDLFAAYNRALWPAAIVLWVASAWACRLLAARRWSLAVIPLVWSVIGGSAAVLLGVWADYMLPIGGVLLTLHSTLTVKDALTANRRPDVSAPDRRRPSDR